MPFVPNPAWVKYVLTVSVAAFLICGMGTILLFREARVFAAIYVVINLYFMAMMYFLATMAVTGVWL
jgi:hypothetical protein